MGKIAIRTRELKSKICQTDDAEVLAGYVEKDYIHLFGIRAATFISRQIGPVYEEEHVPKTTEGI